MSPLAFVATYAVAVVALVPALSLTIAGSALYGVVAGTIYSLIGATAGSTAAFAIARYVARGFVARRIAAMPRVQAVDRAVSARGRPIVFLLRLSPLVPFNVLNYALGITTISLGDFLIGSAGMVPGALFYAYAGHAAREVAGLAGTAQVPRTASYYVLLLSGLGATLLAMTLIGRTARRALRDV